jgi:hypothetical protein
VTPPSLVLPSSMGTVPLNPVAPSFVNREDQRAVLNDRVRGIEVDEVAVERPVARCPAAESKLSKSSVQSRTNCPLSYL